MLKRITKSLAIVLVTICAADSAPLEDSNGADIPASLVAPAESPGLLLVLPGVGYSGGGGIAALAVNALDESVSVNRLVLLAPAISPDYPVDVALLGQRIHRELCEPAGHASRLGYAHVWNHRSRRER